VKPEKRKVQNHYAEQWGRGRWVRYRRVVLREKDSSFLVTNASFEAKAETRASITTCCSRFEAYTSDTRFRYFLFSIIILFVWKRARRWRPGWFRVV